MKIVSLFVLLSLSFFSCQKELSFEKSSGNNNNPGTGGTPAGGDTGGSTNTTYFIRCKMDGAPKTFNFNNRATIVDFADAKNLSLSGSATSTASNFEGINLAINFQNGLPATGTYSENDHQTDYVLSGVYNPNSMTTLFAAGINPNSSLPLTVTITSLSSTTITGTFQGAFYKQDILGGVSSTTDFKRITEGEFNLPIK